MQHKATGLQQNLEEKQKQKVNNFVLPNKIDKKDCLVCLNIQNYPSIFCNEIIKQKYDKAFFFYFAKPINEILTNTPLPHVAVFKEYLFLDDDNEYLKRQYKKQEVNQRILSLTNFYESVFPEVKPTLYALDVAPMLVHRKEKLEEIHFLKQEKLQKFPPLMTDRPDKEKNENQLQQINNNNEYFNINDDDDMDDDEEINLQFPKSENNNNKNNVPNKKNIIPKEEEDELAFINKAEPSSNNTLEFDSMLLIDKQTKELFQDDNDEDESQKLKEQKINSNKIFKRKPIQQQQQQQLQQQNANNNNNKNILKSTPTPTYSQQMMQQQQMDNNNNIVANEQALDGAFQIDEQQFNLEINNNNKNNKDEQEQAEFPVEGSFLKAYNQYETHISYESSFYDIYNPKFTSCEEKEILEEQNLLINQDNESQAQTGDIIYSSQKKQLQQQSSQPKLTKTQHSRQNSFQKKNGSIYQQFQQNYLCQIDEIFKNYVIGPNDSWRQSAEMALKRSRSKFSSYGNSTAARAGSTVSKEDQQSPEKQEINRIVNTETGQIRANNVFLEQIEINNKNNNKAPNTELYNNSSPNQIFQKKKVERGNFMKLQSQLQNQIQVTIQAQQQQKKNENQNFLLMSSNGCSALKREISNENKEKVKDSNPYQNSKSLKKSETISTYMTQDSTKKMQSFETNSLSKKGLRSNQQDPFYYQQQSNQQQQQSHNPLPLPPNHGQNQQKQSQQQQHTLNRASTQKYLFQSCQQQQGDKNKNQFQQEYSSNLKNVIQKYQNDDNQLRKSYSGMLNGYNSSTKDSNSNHEGKVQHYTFTNVIQQKQSQMQQHQQPYQNNNNGNKQIQLNENVIINTIKNQNTSQPSQCIKRDLSQGKLMRHSQEVSHNLLQEQSDLYHGDRQNQQQKKLQQNSPSPQQRRIVTANQQQQQHQHQTYSTNNNNGSGSGRIYVSPEMRESPSKERPDTSRSVSMKDKMKKKFTEKNREIKHHQRIQPNKPQLLFRSLNPTSSAMTVPTQHGNSTVNQKQSFNINNTSASNTLNTESRYNSNERTANVRTNTNDLQTSIHSDKNHSQHQNQQMIYNTQSQQQQQQSNVQQMIIDENIEFYNQEDINKVLLANSSSNAKKLSGHINNSRNQQIQQQNSLKNLINDNNLQSFNANSNSNNNSSSGIQRSMQVKIHRNQNNMYIQNTVPTMQDETTSNINTNVGGYIEYQQSNLNMQPVIKSVIQYNTNTQPTSPNINIIIQSNPQSVVQNKQQKKQQYSSGNNNNSLNNNNNNQFKQQQQKQIQQNIQMQQQYQYLDPSDNSNSSSQQQQQQQQSQQMQNQQNQQEFMQNSQGVLTNRSVKSNKVMDSNDLLGLQDYQQKVMFSGTKNPRQKSSQLKKVYNPIMISQPQLNLKTLKERERAAIVETKPKQRQTSQVSQQNLINSCIDQSKLNPKKKKLPEQIRSNSNKKM